MKISILSENCAGAFTMAEHGLSYLIQHNGRKLLFDTGQSDLFLRNAEKMKVDLSDVDKVILSHGHFDHGNGLEYVKGNDLICHPGCFVKRYRKGDRREIGLKYTRQELSGMFSLITTETHYSIDEKILFLGEIPRQTDFESASTSFVFENGEPDFVMDDSAAVFILDEGLFIVTGCGHSGIVNTAEHARKVTGIERIYGIIGGLHLKEYDRQTIETIRYLEKNKVKHVLPSHCTELPALAAFYDSFGIIHVKTGCVLDF